MKPLCALLAVCCLSALPLLADETVKMKIIQTSDVHGNYFPEDFITRTPSEGSLARVHTYAQQMRAERGKQNVLLLDNGDILQGQPTAYYYNFIDTVAPHLTSSITRFMGYDAGTIGNHDVETGHSVYDRWVAQNAFPTLGANVVNANTGLPYLRPYAIINKNGVKVAVLGLLTEGIPGWLPENLWSGLRFEDMQKTAAKWVPFIREVEKPDLMIGMFHSGRDSTKRIAGVAENASMMVARHVPGFDIVLMGHDHSPYYEVITNDFGKKVVVANPANLAHRVADIDVTFTRDARGKVFLKEIDGRITDMSGYEPSVEFLEKFSSQRDSVANYVSRKIGSISAPLTTRDAYFGPSSFIDFIHQMQLDLTGADISFSAPLSFDATIPAGDIHVSDMFNLYKYENMLYTMALTGQEIKDYLEMSYDIWTNTMKSPDDHLLRLKDGANASDMTHTGFQYPSYNFDSAAGIIYTVDVTKPRGEKISITSMADGSPFDPAKTYKVAINSYRGNGGGNLLTDGAGIPAKELSGRILTSTDKDLRYYLMEYIASHPEGLNPQPLNQWRFIPEEVAAPAAVRDRALLFAQ